MVRKIKHTFIYSFLGIASFLIGLVLMPFSVGHRGGSVEKHSGIANAEVPTPDPDPTPTPTPTPDPTPDPCPTPTPDPTPCPTS